MKVNWTRVQQAVIIGFFVFMIIFLCLQIQAQLARNRMEREAHEAYQKTM